MSSTVPYWQDEPYTARPALEGERRRRRLHRGCGRRRPGHGVAARRARASRRWCSRRREVASGASGRNGGFFIAGTAPMYNDARRLFGADVAWRLHAATLAAQQEVYALAQSIGAAVALPPRRDAAPGRRRARGRARPRARARPARRRLPRRAGARPSASRRPSAGPTASASSRAHDASVHPTRWLRALARALEGARRHDPRGQRRSSRRWASATASTWCVRTPGGRVRARRVVAAADGDLGRLVRAVPRARATRCACTWSRRRRSRTRCCRTRSTRAAATSTCSSSRTGASRSAASATSTPARSPRARSSTRGSWRASSATSSRSSASSCRSRTAGSASSATRATSGRWPATSPACPGCTPSAATAARATSTRWVAGRIVADLIANGQSPDEDLLEPDR